MIKHADIDSLSHQINAFKNKTKENGSEEPSSNNALKGFHLCIEFLSGIFIGLSIGLFIDWFFNTKPWFLVIFIIFGTFAGVLNAYRFAKQESSES